MAKTPMVWLSAEACAEEGVPCVTLSGLYKSADGKSLLSSARNNYTWILECHYSCFFYGHQNCLSRMSLPSDLSQIGWQLFLFSCHQNSPPKNKTLMSNISGTPVFTGFVGSSRTFKTSAFNHSAISPEEKPASAIITGFRAEVNGKNGHLVDLMGVFGRFW